MLPKKIILHHSLTKDSGTVSWGAIRRYHLNKGWANIGYHWGIEKINGHYEILLGRFEDEQGAHCKSHNQDSLGICFIGNFDLRPPTPKQFELGVNLVKVLITKYGIKPNFVFGHNHFSSKTCPGKLFDIEKFRRFL